jgi:hypothetical protein
MVPPPSGDPWEVAAAVAVVLEDVGVRYAIGGSIASGVVGEPRSTLDVDIVVELESDQVDALAERLSARFYVPIGLIRRAVRDRSSATVIDTLTALKVDLFIAGGTPLDRDGLDRRVATVSADVARPLYVHTPEDVLLQKLRWYRKGGEVSDRQWRDVVGIVRVQRSRLDSSYLAYGADLLGVTDLLARVLAQE